MAVIISHRRKMKENAAKNLFMNLHRKADSTVCTRAAWITATVSSTIFGEGKDPIIPAMAICSKFVCVQMHMSTYVHTRMHSHTLTY